MSSQRSQAVFESMFQMQPTKSQQQQLSILDAAIKSLATNGIQGTSYASIAKDCGISRPLIHHYFPEFNDLVRQAAVYVRAVMQDYGTSFIKSSETSPTSQLKAYIEANFSWPEKYPTHYKFWLLFYYQTGFDKKARTEHTKLAKLGQERVEGFIRQGIEEKEWRAPSSVSQTAKMIQMMITGAMLTSMTEDTGYSLKEFSQQVAKVSLLLLKSS